jgi:hypothetical protein
MLGSFGRASIFVLPCVVSLLALVGVLVVLPRSGPRERVGGRFGVLAVTFFSGALVCALLAISESTRHGWASPVVVGLCGASVALGLAWADRERRARVPFIDLTMMRLRGMWTSNLVAFMAGVGLFGCAAALPALLQTPRSSGFGVGAGLDRVGVLMAPIALAAFATSLGASRLYRTFSARTLLVVGAGFSCLSFLGVAFRHNDQWGIVGWCVLQGVGNGLILSTLASVVVAAVPARQTGVANGMNTNIRTLGGSLGAAMTAAVLTTRTHAGIVAESAFVAVFVMMAGAMAVAGLAALLVPGTPAGRRRGRPIGALVPDAGLTGAATVGID